MRKLLLAIVGLIALAAPAIGADATPVVVMMGNNPGYTVTHSTISISSFSANTYAAAGGYREFMFVDNTLTAANSYYYMLSTDTSNIVGGGIVFTTPYTLESSNPVSLQGPAGVAARTVRVRIRTR